MCHTRLAKQKAHVRAREPVEFSNTSLKDLAMQLGSAHLQLPADID